MPRVARSAAAAAVVLAVGVAIAPVAGAATTTPLPVAQRVLRTGDLPGYRSTAPARVVFTPKAFASLIGQPAEAGKFARAGFVRASFQSLPGPKDTIAFSEALQYDTAAQARSEALRLFREDKASAQKALPFSVGGVIGSRAQMLSAPDGSRQASVYFADGPFLYFGAVAGGPGGPIDRAALALAVKALYQRVKDSPPLPSS